MISILSASRRYEGYKKLLANVESLIPDLINEYLVFIDKKELKPEYDAIKKDYPKLKIILAPENYIWKNGWDSVYNLLGRTSKSKFNWLLFDSDVLTISNISQFKDDLNSNFDLLGIPTMMQRGSSQENKFQLYKNDELLAWLGVIHESPQFLRQPNIKILDYIQVNHNNALDKNSKKMKKNEDGIPIIEIEEEGTDGYERNVLYEGLVFKVVNFGERQLHRDYLVRYYEANKKAIDYYYKRACEKWGN